ncbi:MAG: glutamine amidotransferase [Cyanophyceae cyanobacterium]
MKKILIVVHQATSTPGLVGKLLQTRGYELDIRKPSLGDRLPETMAEHEAVIIFGGPMSANDDRTLPHIRQELDWIPVALNSNKPFLGICLGAQLLARVLGAKVTPHPEGMREIGYYPIRTTPAGQAQFDSLKYVYHWHQEGFDLPSGAVALAEGETFANQAFRYGKRAYGFQFHPEMTRALMRLWMSKAAEQLSFPGAQSPSQQLQLQALYGRQGKQWLKEFLSTWLNGS